jgi:hypothetical protein
MRMLTTQHSVVARTSLVASFVVLAVLGASLFVGHSILAAPPTEGAEVSDIVESDPLDAGVRADAADQAGESGGLPWQRG